MINKHRGLVQVYTGQGKGKTTAALGLAFRALGRGFSVVMFQFMKPPQSSGEHLSAARLGDSLRIQPVGRARWLGKKGVEQRDKDLAREGLAQAQKCLADFKTEGRPGLVILDEIALALKYGLVEPDQVLELINARPAQVELVLTGRDMPQEIIQAADLVTEMTPLKHPFEQGVKARQGIEF